MDVKFELTGKMQEDAERKSLHFRKANWTAMKRRGDALKERLRKDVAASGIKNATKVSKIWRGDIYPRKFNGAPNPAYRVSNKAPWIFEALEKGPVIRFRSGAGLIPVGPAARFKLPPFQSRVSIVQKMRAQYGELQSFKTRKGIFLGVWQDGPKGKKKFLPLFKLVREVKSPDLLNAEGIIQNFKSTFGGDYAAELQRVYDELEAPHR